MITGTSITLSNELHLWYIDSLHSHLQFSFTVVAVTDADQIVTCPPVAMTFRRLDLALAPHVSLNETQALVLIIEIETDGRDSFTRWLSALGPMLCSATMLTVYVIHSSVLSCRVHVDVVSEPPTAS